MVDPGEMVSLLPLIQGFAGLVMGVLMILLIIPLYIYGALAFMKIAKRTNTPNGWLAWIPIANIYLITQIAGVPWWTMFAFLLSIIPVVGQFAFAAVGIWWFWKIAEARGKPGWWGVLMIIPVVNLVILGILAWGK